MSKSARYKLKLIKEALDSVKKGELMESSFIFVVGSIVLGWKPITKEEQDWAKNEIQRIKEEE